MDLSVNAPLAELNLRLGLPALDPRVCHGYQNCCVCEDCTDRQRHSGERREIVQPWEIDAAA